MEAFKEQVKKGFAHCKDDIESLKQENSFLKTTLKRLEEQYEKSNELIQQLQNDLIETKAELKGVHIALDYLRDFKQEQPTQQTQAPKEETPQVRAKPTPATKDPYEALLEFKAKANKREIIKQKMLSLVSNNGMNLSELKFMIVDHFRYCSKATFYNYLKELELEKHIKIEREQTKNYVYLNSLNPNF